LNPRAPGKQMTDEMQNGSVAQAVPPGPDLDTWPNAAVSLAPDRATKISFPVNPRELLKAFHLYDSMTGLDSLIQKIDFFGIQRHHLYYSILGRLPETGQVAVSDPALSIAEEFGSMLQSPEFQENIVRIFLTAFPELRRFIFIHVPKCAGSHLIDTLGKRYSHIGQNTSSRNWIPKSHLFDTLKNISLSIQNNTHSIFVFGHVCLDWYLERELIRPEDSAFTIVRNPVDIVISNTNYIIRRLLENPEAQDPDVKEWTGLLGLGRIKADAPHELRGLALEILMNPAVTHGSLLCHMLGNGDARSAIDSLIRCDLEITEIGRYNLWLEEKWGIPPGPKRNVSPSIINRENLENEYFDYILDITREDRKLYALIMSSLNASAELSIRGSVLHRRSYRGGGGVVVETHGFSEPNAMSAEFGQFAQARQRLQRERDGALAERDSIAQQRDAALAERDDLARELQNRQQERDAAVAECDALRVRCDRLDQERAALAATSAALARERDAVAAERDRFTEDRAALAAELWRASADREAALTERDAVAAERERFAEDRAALAAELLRLSGECETAAQQRDAARAELARRRRRRLAARLRRLVRRRSL